MTVRGAVNKKVAPKLTIKYTEKIIANIAALCAYILLRKAGGEIGVVLALGLLAAILQTKSKNWIFAISYIISGAFFGAEQFISGAVAAVILTIIAIIYGNLKKTPHRALCILYLAISEVFYIVFAIKDTEQLLLRLIGVGVSVLIAVCFTVVLKAVFHRGLKYLPAYDELICISIIGAVLMMGLQGFALFGVTLSKLIAPFLILIIMYIFGAVNGVTAASVLGVGASFYSGNLEPLAIFALWGLSALCFMKVNRILSALALLFTDIALTFWFSNTPPLFLNFIAVALSVAAFVIIPLKLLSKAQSRFSTAQKYSSRHIINRLRNNLSVKLYELSDIFFAMQLTFKSMIRGVMPADKAKIAIAKDVCEQVCPTCPERIKCWRMHLSDTEDTFIAMVDAAIDRGKTTVLDVNNSLAARCGRINSVIAAVNTQVYSYKQYYTMTVNSDNSKILIADQMMGVSQILKSLSQESKTTVTFDNAKERNLIEELTALNILCKEAVFYDDGKQLCAALVLDCDDAKRSDLSTSVSRAAKSPLMIDKIEATENTDWKVVHFIPRPSYDVTFGFKSERKFNSDISGDTHSFLKIAGDKFLLALCDGMGSGKAAEEASSRAVSLVENFYKAGFDSDTILSSVNRLLATANDELFTAVDIAVINLRNGLADFIKIGAPSGIIRQGGISEFIEGGSLPMGVLDEMRPVITKKALNVGDYIYLFSDGVEQAFNGKQNLAQFINALPDSDPQLIADAIIEGAISISPKPKDDMTIIVAKVI
ncbi:MAG: SpoIIE family protein phosphatase [Clostridia bacterium]